MSSNSFFLPCNKIKGNFFLKILQFCGKKLEFSDINPELLKKWIVREKDAITSFIFCGENWLR